MLGPKASESKDRSVGMQLALHKPDDVSVADPRQLPVEERLRQAEEHETKLRHIMETVPIKIRHLQGSSAGAGSGEFHIYRNARNQEQKRMREMEATWKADQERLAVKRKHEDAQLNLEAKTAKNRAKRMRSKAKKPKVPRSVDDPPQLASQSKPAPATEEYDLD